MNSRQIKANVVTSILLQIATIISGFIIPRALIQTFGSETNGLVASISQFINYITLLEGGVTSVAVASLYKPVRQEDYCEVGKRLAAIKRYFQILSLLCCAFTVLVGLLYPLFIRTEFSYLYVFCLTLVLGGHLIIQYALSISYKLLLRANQKVYYIALTQLLIVIVNLCAVLLVLHLYPDILAVKLVSCLVYLIQPLMYTTYVNKHYKIPKPPKEERVELEQKWDGFGQNLAYFIHSNTDIILLTIFSTLANVSVYSVYLLVAGALKTIVITVSSSLSPTIGNILVDKDIERSNRIFTTYELIVILPAFVLFTIGMELIVSFVAVYTAGISDANYYQPAFGIIILLAEMVYCVRDPYVNVAYASDHFRQTAKYAYLEAGINITISIVLVHIWGLAGVAVGTFIAMFIRAMQQVVYLKNNILYRSPYSFVKKVLVFAVTSLISYTICELWIVRIASSYGEWILQAIICSVITGLLYACSSWLFFKKDLKSLISYLK